MLQSVKLPAQAQPPALSGALLVFQLKSVINHKIIPAREAAGHVKPVKLTRSALVMGTWLLLQYRYIQIELSEAMESELKLQIHDSVLC